MGSRLASYLVAGAVAGFLFFAALVALILGGLREPYVSTSIVCGAGAVFAAAYWKASFGRRNHGGLRPKGTGPTIVPAARSPSLGPNLFIWIAIGVVIASLALALFGYGWAVWGYPVAIGLVIFNKVRAIRRRRAEASRTFD